MRHFVCAAVLLLLPSLAVAQEKTIPTPANVKVEGMPPIPQAILDGLSRYSQFRQAQMIAWHPTRRQVLITTAFGQTPQLHFVDGPGRDRRQLTWLDRGVSATVNASFDPTDPDSFVFQYDSSAELRSLYRYNLVTNETSLVTEARSRYVPVWSRQGKWLAYDSSERNGRDRDLYVIQPSDPSTKRRLADFVGPWSPHDWAPDGLTLVANEVRSNSETYLWRIDVKTGEKKLLTPREEKAAWFNSRFSSDGKKVYVISDRIGGDFRLWRCDLAIGEWSPVTPAGVRVDLGGGFELSPDGGLLAAAIDKGPYTELQIIDLTTMKARPLPEMPRGTVTQLRWRPGSREIGFTLGSVKTLGDVYSVDTSLGTLARWTTSEGSFNPDLLPAPELVDWKSADGQAFSGLLYRPAAKFTGPRPVIVSLHGGPDDRERMVFRGRSNYLLNELGFAIIYPNVRGSLGFGRAFEQMDNGQKRGDVIKDVGAVLDWIAARPELDKNRVVLLGVSSGGWLALEAGIVYNDRIRAIVEGAGMTDLVTFLQQTDGPRQENRRREYGD